MAVDERARHQLHTRLEEILGAEPATTLMSYLPPVGWADVATKRDLDQLADRFDAALHREIGAFRADVDARFETQRDRFDELRAEFASQTRTLLLGVGGIVLSIATLAFAALQLT